MKHLKYKKAQVFYKGKPIKPVQKILSIYEDDDGSVSVNFGLYEGSYPDCKRISEKLLKIPNGYKCDYIKLI